MDYDKVSRRLRSCSTLKGWLYGRRDMGLDGACLVCDVFGKTIDELACRGES